MVKLSDEQTNSAVDFFVSGHALDFRNFQISSHIRGRLTRISFGSIDCNV